MTAIDDALSRLTRLYPRAVDLSLDRMRALMTRLGDPQNHLPPVVHVAGTNGKGSTIAIMRACLEAAGRLVHVYTSPHLVRFNERIRLAGSLIEDGPLLDLLAEVERRNDGAPITQFEITTAAAFLAFARTPADVLLLEVGLGGRLDATNIVARPAVTAITPVSFDHMNYFGDRIELIAAEKAGIIKPGRPVIVARQPPAALAVIEAEAARRGAPVLLQDRDWRAIPAEDGWRFEGKGWDLALPPPSLPGQHQIDNAGTALACLETLADMPLAPDRIAEGLTHVEWPARLQRLSRGPLARMLPESGELWLDGAHNEGGGTALAAFIAAWRDRPPHLIAAALETRYPRDFLRPLAPFAASLRGVAIPDYPGSHAAETMAEAGVALGLRAAPAASVADAVTQILREDAAPRILICGSLYLAGAVLAENG